MRMKTMEEYQFFELKNMDVEKWLKIT